MKLLFLKFIAGHQLSPLGITLRSRKFNNTLRLQWLVWDRQL